MNVNRRLTADQLQYLRDCLAVHQVLLCPYASARIYYQTAKLFTGMDAAHALHLAILRRRKDQAALRLRVGVLETYNPRMLDKINRDAYNSPER